MAPTVSQRAAAAPLVPVDHRELLLESERALEVAGLVEHGQARALLDHEEDGVGFVLPTSTNPLRGSAELNGLERVDHHGVLLSESELWSSERVPPLASSDGPPARRWNQATVSVMASGSGVPESPNTAVYLEVSSTNGCSNW